MSCCPKKKPSLFRRIIKLKVSLVKVLLFIALFTFTSAKGPEFHANFIRSYVGEKVVMLKAGRSGGSGSYVKAESGKTFILTNKHVCKISNDGYMKVFREDGSHATRKIIKMSAKYDLCLVDAAEDFDGLFVANKVAIGETIAIVGHPKLQPLTLSKGELIGYRNISVASRPNADGTCSSKPLLIIDPELKDAFQKLFGYCVNIHYSGQTTAYSRGGSSGSPVIDFFGSLVGVLFAGNRQDQFESYIVPLASVKEFLSEF